MHLRALIVIVILVTVLGGLCTLWLNSIDFGGSSPTAPMAVIAVLATSTPTLPTPRLQEGS